MNVPYEKWLASVEQGLIFFGNISLADTPAEMKGEGEETLREAYEDGVLPSLVVSTILGDPVIEPEDDDGR